ncbi:capsular polysaccharide export protein, LipB/KpsS family [Prosthecomicrobium sp. N25]|uniref:capsular polysaccharide export protein, LipB/KpsS family n=1 Tax=Prosthecomicrobium sp. N25 TaxID=3129254 RepID=UPI00307845DD
MTSPTEPGRRPAGREPAPAPGPGLRPAPVRAAVFLPEPWAAAAWLPALCDADEVVPSPGDDEGGRVDRVIGGLDPRLEARGRDHARRFRLPFLRLEPLPLGPASPPSLGIAHIAARLCAEPIPGEPVPAGARTRAGQGAAVPSAAVLQGILDLVLGDRLLAASAAALDDPAEAHSPVTALVADAADDGTADPDRLLGLLAEARARHGDGAVAVVPVDPRAAAGRPPILAALAVREGLRLRPDRGRPDLLAGIDTVYAAGGLLGLEALLAGRRAVLAAAPDWLAPFAGRRLAPAERLDLARIAFVDDARYADPFTGAAVDAEAGLGLLAWLRRRYAGRRANRIAYGFSAQKARTARTFLEGWEASVAVASRPASAIRAAARSGARLTVWGTRGGAALDEAAARAGLRIDRLEDGFIRSVGLGTMQTIPASLALDDEGLYYDARRPSRFERLAETAVFDEALLMRARALREAIVAARVTKYNLAAEALDFRARSGGRPVILAPGQVPDDAAIRTGTFAVTGNLALLAAIRKERPDAYIVYKEHPDLVTRSRAGWLPDRLVLEHADEVLRRGDAIAAIEAADEVHTMTSLAGFEALLRGVPVTTWGLPFYAGWGLTADREHTPRRRRRLSLDELVAVALILYPAYVDPVSRLPCEVEDIVRRIAQIREGRVAPPPATRFRALVRASVVAEAWIRHLLGHRLTPR